MTTNLPQELVDVIVDHLAGDSSSLKACSLASCAWVPRTRLYLFEICSLTSATVFSFSVILRSPHCTFLPHIRSIHVSGDVPNSTPYNSFDEPAFLVDLHRLTGVRMLEVELIFKRTHGEVAKLAHTNILSAFPHLTRLSLTNVPMPTVVQLVDTIALFLSLEELHLALVCPLPAFTKSMVVKLPPRALHSLTLCRYSVGPILAWLHAAEHLPKIRSLKLPSLWRHEVPIVCVPLEHLRNAGALNHLRLLDAPLVWLLGGASDTAPLFNLSDHPALHTLILQDYAFPYEMLSSLMQLVAPSLECLTFDLDLPSYRRFDWATLDAFLANSGAFKRLKRVVFLQTIGYTEPREDAFLRKVLPMLESSGMLQTKWLRLSEK
ncbi:hypothetical protein DFH08DRAFT_399940 [Mycena albidolilacea]|uniref:F-box domain-containing protein n=1 Tax=Mycena albidolilacea TaxID=1033008 RepID=A0AAD7EEF7_9AGAR|nr:hypothetical protein DFH08DRAFT_399940 [Mycena albidolilacea]